MEIPQHVIMWLIGANIVLMVFIIIDRMVLMAKKSDLFEQKFFQTALVTMQQKIDEMNKKVTDAAIAREQAADYKIQELLAQIRTSVFHRYEQEFKLLEDAAKNSSVAIQLTTDETLQSVKKDLERSKNTFQDSYSTITQNITRMSEQINTLTQETIQKIIEKETEMIRNTLKKRIEQDIDSISHTILRDSISLKDHESLINQSIEEYLNDVLGKQKK